MLKKSLMILISLFLVLGIIIPIFAIPKAHADMFDIDTDPGLDSKKLERIGETQAEKDLKKNAEKTREKKDKNYKKKKKKKRAEKAYAKYMFDDTAKNQTLMYYKAQTNAGSDTVESIIDDKATEGAGKPYATFLNTLYNWNLYKTYSDQVDVGKGIIVKGIKLIFGVPLLCCFYLLDGIDHLLGLLGDLVGYLNIWQYLTDSQGEIPKDSPFYALNPFVQMMHKLTTLAKIFIAIFLGWIAFRLVTGVGRARSRGTYFKNGISKVIYAMLSVAFAALFISSVFGLISDMLKNAGGVSTSAVEKIPATVIVDDRQYIDNSLNKIKGKKGSEGTNNGYILNHDHPDFPKNPKDMANKIPSQKLVQYMNTDGNKEIEEKLDGKQLLKDWTFSTKYTALDIDSMYSLSEGDSKFMGLGKGKDAVTQFKLSPGPQGVKLFGGKDFISFDLKDVSIESASLVGNTALGQCLNAVKMAAMIFVVTFVITSLFIAVVRGLISAYKDFIVNFSFSQLGFYQAFFGIFITTIMILMNIFLFFAIIGQFPDLVTATDAKFTESLNQDSKFSGVVKQFLQTILSLIALWICAMLAHKLHKGVLTMVGQWFTQILETLNPDSAYGSSNNAHHRALQNALGSNTYGNEAATGMLTDPIGSAQSGMQSLKDLKEQGEEKATSLKSLMGNDEEDGYGSNGQSSSQFSGRVSATDGDSDYQDADAQGEQIEENIQEGLSGLEQQSDKAIDKNLDSQERSVGEATEAFEKLNDAETELQNAKDEYDRLEKNDASPEELQDAQSRIDAAQNDYDKQLGIAQGASQSLAKSGASVGDVAQGRVQSMQDFHNAGEEIQKAETELQDLQDQRHEMELYGGSPGDIKTLDRRIGEAQDKVDLAKQKQQLAKQAYDANINNPTAEKDARNDLIAANQSEVAARRELSEAQAHGNLTQQQYGSLQQAAKNIQPELEKYSSDLNSRIQQQEQKQHALQFMKNNGGLAFTNADQNVQSQELERADQQVSQIKQDLSQAKANKKPKQTIQELNEQLSNAQAHFANVQSATNTMQSGYNVDDGMNAQQQVVSQAFSRRIQAEKALNNLKKQESAGQLVDRTEMKQAESQFQQAASQHQHAERVLSGIQAVSSVGSKQVSPQQIESVIQDNNSNLDSLAKEQANADKVQSTVNNLEQGGKASAEETSLLSTMQKRIRKDKSARAKQATDNYKATLERLKKLKQQQKRGMPVRSEIKNVEASARQAKKQMNQAVDSETFVAHQGSVIRQTGRTMIQNIQNAQNNVKEQVDKVATRKINHKNILRTGGLSSDQLQNYKKSIAEERRSKEQNKQKFLRERASRISQIRKDLDIKL